MTLVATQVKRRRGTNDENDAFAGAEGEITVDLTNKELRVHDGSGKTGGFRIGRHTDRTNCITECSQDIKLELNDGTLILKAGSKVYVPNGVNVFDVFNVSSDYVSSSTGANQTMVCCYIQDSDSIGFRPLSNCTSGANATATMGYAYDTTTNKIRFFNSSGVIQHNTCSFPIAIVKTDDNGLVASIDQVFNGFGYIGSTKFVLPRVSGLIPDGFNSDGTLKNIPFVVENVLTTTGASTDTAIGFVGADSLANHSSATYKYDPKTNLIVRASDGVPYSSITGVNRIPFTNPYYQINGKIQYCSFYNVFNAVDYSNTEYIAHQAMPSKRRISLTATNEGSYTAPADGYFAFFATANTSNGYAGLKRSGLVVSMFSSLVNTTSGAIETPVRKGEVITLFYGNVGSVTFYFEYAQGATNE